jgi:shikimate dehydrogenase
VDHLQTPAVLNARLAQRGVDAVVVPLHVTAEHLAATMAGMRHLRNFAGYAVSIPHKPMAARLWDELMPNAQACGVVNVIRVAPDGRWIGETLDGIGMVKALTAQRTLDTTTRVLLVGAGGVGRAIAVALALAGVGSVVIVNRTQAKAEDLADTVRRAAPTCAVEAGGAVDAAARC